MIEKAKQLHQLYTAWATTCHPHRTPTPSVIENIRNEQETAALPKLAPQVEKR